MDYANDGGRETFGAHSDCEADTVGPNCDQCRNTVVHAAWSDAHKARLLREVGRLHPSEVDQEAAIALANRLEPKFKELDPECIPTCESAASALFIASEQLRMFSELDDLLDEWTESGFGFKIYPLEWSFEPQLLRKIEAPKLLDSLGSIFDKVGLDARHGVLLGFLQGEYDPVRNLCRLSLAGIASRGTAKLIKKLGHFPTFRDFPFGGAYWDEDDLGDPFIDKVSVWGVDSPAQHEAKLFQSDWPLCPTFLNKKGKFERIEDRRGIPDLLEAQILLWLDQWKLPELTLMVGIVDGEFGLGCASCFMGT